MEMQKKHECEEQQAEIYYKIGLFASINHITVKTLRFYEEKGLLYPAKIDSDTGYRYYVMGQMERLQQIMALKEAGFKIDDILKLDECEDEAIFLKAKKNEILKKISELTLQLSKLDSYINGDCSLISTPVVIKKLPQVVCATVTTRIESYDKLFEIMPYMGQLMEEASCECAIPEYCFTNYLEAGYQEEDILVETCQAVTKKQQDQGNLKFKVFDEVEVASVFHKGSYENFATSYLKILKYIEENGYSICGNIRENYIDGVWNKESEDEWLSEIQIPIVKKVQD